MALIYHLAIGTAWPPVDGLYRGDTLETEGFIHASTAGQVIAVANRLFRGRTDLVALAIDADRVDAPIVFENTEGGAELYPHLYGPLDPGAVVAAVPLRPAADGLFGWPAGLPIDPAAS